jgi:hypothetical protein
MCAQGLLRAALLVLILAEGTPQPRTNYYFCETPTGGFWLNGYPRHNCSSMFESTEPKFDADEQCRKQFGREYSANENVERFYADLNYKRDCQGITK